MKGQISVEMLLTLGMILAFTIPVVLLLFSLSQTGVEKGAWIQAEGSARILADAVNEVYGEGTGVRRTVYLNLPANTQKVVLDNHEITILLDTSFGEYHSVIPVFADMETSELDIRGVAIVRVVNENGQVKVNA